MVDIIASFMADVYNKIQLIENILHLSATAIAAPLTIDRYLHIMLFCFLIVSRKEWLRL